MRVLVEQSKNSVLGLREIHLGRGHALQWCRMGVGVPGKGNLSPPGTG